MSDDLEYVGCSDGGCVFGHPGGMHTNGGCRCLRKYKLAPGMVSELRKELRANRARSRREGFDEAREMAAAQCQSRADHRQALANESRGTVRDAYQDKADAHSLDATSIRAMKSKAEQEAE